MFKGLQFGWTNTTVEIANTVVLLTNKPFESCSVCEPSAYWQFVGERLKFLCMHKLFDAMCKQQRTGTFFNELKTTLNR